MKTQEKIKLPIEISELFPTEIKDCFENLSNDILSKLQEIRIRSDRPIILFDGHQSYFIDGHGNLSVRPIKNSITVSEKCVTEIFEKACEYSVNTHMDEIVNGFVTVRGGHRIGVCGRAVLKNGCIRSVRNISSLNIRIAGDVKNMLTDELTELLKVNQNILICGAPSSGKTTLLKQIMTYLTDGSKIAPKKVSVIDERFELISGFGTGHNCDLLSGYPKDIGIMQAIRTLSPDYIIFDELGGKAECEKITEGCECGVNVITTLHCRNKAELINKANVGELIDKKIFNQIVFLKGCEQPGKIKEIVKGDELCVKNYRQFNDSSRVIFNRAL